jgi:Guanine nucleotide exchange factor synembryn
LELLTSDRNLPLGQSQTLSSRLLRLVTSAFTPTLHESIFSLMFQLVHSSPTALIDAIGYGYASGFLFSHNIPVPSNLQNPQTGRADINPVTGQRLDAEPNLDLVQMTDEEKEHEAERLFVLFERLRGLGVGVENPVRTAQQSGRFEEME